MKLFKGFLLLLLIPFVYTQECTTAQSLYDAGSYSKASEEMKLSINTTFDSDECNFLAYNILFELEEFKEARKYLTELTNHPEYAVLSDLFNRVWGNLKDSEKKVVENFDFNYADDIISDLENILKDDEFKNISKFYSYLGTAYYKKFGYSSLADSMDFELLDLSVNNYRKANNIKSKYDKEILNVSKYLTTLGKTSMNNDELEEALTYFTKATEYDSDYTTAHFYLGQLYMKIQDYEFAAQSFKAGLGSKLKNGNYKILYMLGTCYERMNKLDMAEQFFRYSIANEPTYIKARFSLAKIYYAQLGYDKSKSTVFDILEIDPEYIKAYELLVNVCLDQNDYNSARKYIAEGISIDSKSYFLYSQLALLNNEDENYDMAMSNAKIALDLKRNYGPALIQLGRSYTFLCKSVEAEDAFKRAKRWSRDQAKHWQNWATGYHKEICK